MSGAHLVFSNINNRVNTWTLATGTFTPSTSGTYHLGFHDLNQEAGSNGGFGLYIAIDQIEISGGIPCDPVTNLAVTYTGTEECVAQLTWTAPVTPVTNYEVYRDLTLIAEVETTSYSDEDFEPTLTHEWSVKTICASAFSSEVFVTGDICQEADCNLRPKNFKVTINEENCEAQLKWDAATEVLWDNTQPSTNSGYQSYRCMLEQYSRVNIMADDFVVPAGETWYINEVFYGGFHKTTTGAYDAPDFIGVEIFEDSGDNLPGSKIYEDFHLLPSNGDMNSQTYVILPEAVEIIAPGRYWIAIYGVYDNTNGETTRYFIYAFNEEVGPPLCFLSDEDGEDAWESYPGYSMYFRIQGVTSLVQYNIYRDNEPIATVTDLSYTDTDYDFTVPHTWKVKTVCPTGGESAAGVASKPVCQEDGVTENVNPSFTILPNPANDKIKVSSNTPFNTIEVINFLGQTVISQTNMDSNETTLNISNLNSGIYFVRIKADNGISVQKFVKQ